MQLYTSIANSDSQIRIHNLDCGDVALTVEMLGLQIACEKLFPKVLSVCSFSAAADLSVFPNVARIMSRTRIIRHIPPELDQKVQEIYVKLYDLPSNMNELPRRLTSLFLDIKDQNIIAMNYVRALDSLSEACPHLQFLRLWFNPKPTTPMEQKSDESESSNYARENKFPSKLIFSF